MRIDTNWEEAKERRQYTILVSLKRNRYKSLIIRVRDRLKLKRYKLILRDYISKNRKSKIIYYTLYLLDSVSLYES